MATTIIHHHLLLLFLLLHLSLSVSATTAITLQEEKEQLSPYLISPSLFHHDYHLMLRTLKIHVYTPIHNSTFPSSSPLSLFHESLLRSPFLSSSPSQAHLFYLTSPIDHPRHFARSVRTLRSSSPFWNRSLGADHFFLTLGLEPTSSDRNLLELSKNSIQISSTSPSFFFPHKDLTLPLPLHPRSPPNHHRPSSNHLAFYNGPETPRIAAILADLRGDFLVQDREEAMFCLFFFEVSTIGEALRSGCVPVIVADKAPVDLPFGDLFRWEEMVMLVRFEDGADGVRKAAAKMDGGRYRRMRKMGIKASEHFRWGEDQDEVDVLRTVLYQLWRRRHVIRYSSSSSELEEDKCEQRTKAV